MDEKKVVGIGPIGEESTGEKPEREARSSTQRNSRRVCAGTLAICVAVAGSCIAHEAMLPEEYKTLRGMVAVEELSVVGSDAAFLRDAADNAGVTATKLWQQTSSERSDICLMLAEYPEDTEDEVEWRDTTYLVSAKTADVSAMESVESVTGKEYIRRRLAELLDSYTAGAEGEKQYQITQCGDGLVIVLGEEPGIYADAMGYILREYPDLTLNEQFEMLKTHMKDS